ncbi:helix-turn-helix domain-containing protein [Maribellus maritimus]|uniref:helix-turn-helix domain-containing protein n=1 Tax=Maribellus maritimus TaxID=2870838 RepID=UPI001EECD2E6|nr:helix-turn-helix domain-containing protein [Maribellus maritimus]MCG6189446.1 helix-turn-helix domain-containing protein [Maribellus maritimus]
MQNQIKRYQVKNSLLKKYVKFFWEIQADYLLLEHKVIPSRNINLRFNLSETKHYSSCGGEERLLENVFFAGLYDSYTNIHLKLNGKVHMLGVCFYSDGFYPFFKVPVSEYKNQLFGAAEAGFKISDTITERLKEATHTIHRLEILENELMLMLVDEYKDLVNFQLLFNKLKQNNYSSAISEFCQNNNINIRKLERLFNKYVGLPANTFFTVNRFQNGLNQLLYSDYSKLTDIAYDTGYFDQMHYIKDFKRFAGNTPGNFIRKNNSMLQIGKFV